MGNKIRIKQIDLQGIFSASGQINLLSASNYAEFVTQLDTTMSSDSELAAVSSSISQSTYRITQTLGSGLVSGSSQLTSSYDTRYILSGSITPLNTGSFATTGSNTFYGDQEIDGQITASYYLGDGRYLNNLSATTNWNYNQEYTIKKTEQLTFSGDYMLENTYLYIEGGQSASIGEWGEDIFTNGPTGSITRNSNNQYTIIGPSGDTNGSNGLHIKRLFDTDTTMSVSYIWNGTDVVEDRPYYDVSTWEPLEPTTTSRLQDTNTTSESGTWTINVPSGSWLAIGVWTDFIDATSGSLQITLPYILNEDISQYSPNKYFKKEGSIFIGGNLLVKDSTIVNNGRISVGGEVILIGNSDITGTGIII